ncbi:hypothetical protein JCM33374_g3241 [Metschnikowia sp. JCM 33374]|nr:hypothetical protein JCM33374_g3241 [Metschnikowia sp. JCM 33374]
MKFIFITSLFAYLVSSVSINVAIGEPGEVAGHPLTKYEPTKAYNHQTVYSYSAAWQLDNFTTYLKSFITWERFDFEEFQLVMNRLWDRIFHIRDHIKNTTDFGKKQSDQLSYAENMFITMLEAAQLMKFFKNDHSLMQTSVYEIVQLNIQILQFYNSTGHIDLSVPGYNHLVRNGRKMLAFLKSVVKVSREQSQGLVFLFDLEYEKAHNAISVLETYLPTEKELSQETTRNKEIWNIPWITRIVECLSFCSFQD